MVSNLKIQILRSIIYLMWFYFLTNSEFNCLANDAKPGTPWPPTLHFVQNREGNRSMHQLRISQHERRFLSIVLSYAPVVTVANDGVACVHALQSQIYTAIFFGRYTVTHIEC